MNVENQVCSLGQAKKLAELGVVQREGIFEWCVFMPDPTGEMWYYSPVYLHEMVEDQLHEWIASAFTVAELGLMLPDLLIKKFQYELVCIKEADDEWLLRYCRNNNMLDTYPQLANAAGKTEAEARANELIYLLENKFITSEDCNIRLQG